MYLQFSCLKFKQPLIKLIAFASIIIVFSSACKKSRVEKGDVVLPPAPTDSISPGGDISIDANLYGPVDIITGSKIFRSGYIDQPYVLKLRNHSWICTYTKSPSGESVPNETIGVSISNNDGATWQAAPDLEPATGPDAFYAVPFLNANGRVYIFYSYNIDNANNGVRYDLAGKMCYKYSDDNGKTWSDRFIIEMPVTYLDRFNFFRDNGKHQSWWTICKPILSSDGQMYFSFTKNGFSDTHEGYIVNSPNINTEKDNANLVWNFYPGSDRGIRSPVMGDAQEEHNIVQLNSGGFACVYRTALGFPAISYSNDNCSTWSTPLPMRYHATSDTMRNPRACPRIFKCSNGKYLFWYHNDSYLWGHRNPVWIAGGVEVDGVIQWSQPEILLYSQVLTQFTLISYPDLIEVDDKYYFTETQKKDAMLHQVNSELLNRLWSQGKSKLPVNSNLVSSYAKSSVNNPSSISINNTANWTGTSLEVQFNTDDLDGAGDDLVTTSSGRDTVSKVLIQPNGNIAMNLYSGNKIVFSLSGDKDLLNKSGKNIISFMLDNKSRVLTAMFNGVLCNRSEQDSKQGWGRLPVNFNFKAIDKVSFKSSLAISRLRVFNVGMRTSDMISEYMYLSQ
jgi:hypothetical protein